MGGGEFSFIFKPYHGFVLISCCKENTGVNRFEKFIYNAWYSNIGLEILA